MARKSKKQKHPAVTPYGPLGVEAASPRKWRIAALVLGVIGGGVLLLGHFLLPEQPRFIVWLLGLVCAVWATTVFVLATHQPEEDELALRLERGVALDFGKALRASRQERGKVKLPGLGEVTFRQIGGGSLFLAVFLWWLTPWAPIAVAERKLEDPAQVLGEEILSTVLVLTNPHCPIVQLPIQPPKIKALAGYLPAGPSRLDLAWKALAGGQFDEARKQFQAVMEETSEPSATDQAILGLAQTEMYCWKFSQALEAYEKLLQRNRQDPFVLGQAAVAAIQQARYAQAAQWLEEALKLADSAAGTDPQKLRVLVVLLHGKATLLTLWGRSAQQWEEAAQIYGRTKDLLGQQEVFGSKPPLLAAAVNNQAVLQQLRSRFAGVQALHHQSRDVWMSSFGAAHPHVAVSWTNVAFCHLVLGEFDLADQSIQKASAVFQKQPSLDEASPLRSPTQCAVSLLARTYAQYQEAEVPALQALRSLEQTLGTEHPAVIGPVCALALSYGELGRYISSATPFFFRAEAVGEKSLGKDHPMMAVITLWEAQLQVAQKQYAAAKQTAEKALKLALDTYGEEHLVTATIFNTLGQAELELGRIGEARLHLEKALRILEKTVGKEAPEMIQTQACLAALESGPITYSKGQRAYEKAISMLENLLGEEHKKHPAVARLQVRCARLLMQNQRAAEAEPFLQRALEIQQTVFAQTQPNHPDLADTLETYANLLVQRNPPDPVQAEKFRQQAQQIRLRHQEEDRLKIPGG